MATYNGRRGPNFSQYLRELNMQESMPLDDLTFISEEDYEKDLARFTNTQFFDFETGQNTDFQAQLAKPENEKKPAAAASAAATEDVTQPDTFMGDFNASLDFLSGDFNYGDFSNSYTSPTIPTFPDHLSSLQPIQPIQPIPQQAYHPSHIPQHEPAYGTQAPLVPGDKSKAAEVGPPIQVVTFEEKTRRLAEEDKRRRNTAASARFRVKKKQREQALEKSAKEMNDKVTALEGRISTLETENKWLRSLVMDKHMEGKEELSKLLSLDKEELSKLLKELKVKEGTAGSDLGSEDDGGSKASSSKSEIEVKPSKIKK